MRSLSALALLALPSLAAAGAGPLPLARGTYVMRGTSCADPAFAAMRSYDGIGLGDPHSHACRLRVVARHGARYVIDNSCIGAGVGPATRATERLTLTITRRDAFAIGATFYRYCPAAALPPELRHSAER